MMLTIEALLAGKGADIPAHFVAARDRWVSLLQGLDERGIRELAGALAFEQQAFFEHHGGRYIGQEIMVASGIGYLVGRGEHDLAAALARALFASMCSTEVKSATERIAELYGLGVGRWGEQR